MVCTRFVVWLLLLLRYCSGLVTRTGTGSLVVLRPRLIVFRRTRAMWLLLRMWLSVTFCRVHVVSGCRLTRCRMVWLFTRRQRRRWRCDGSSVEGVVMLWRVRLFVVVMTVVVVVVAVLAIVVVTWIWMIVIGCCCCCCGVVVRSRGF